MPRFRNRLTIRSARKTTLAEQPFILEQEPRPNFRMPSNDVFSKGPETGKKLPDFTLPDQHGKAVTFSEARAGKKALVMFHRSAQW